MSPEEIDDYNERNLITKNSEFVKSKGELYVANYLYQREIEYEYEKKMELSNGKIVVPDFLLSSWSYQIVIEFWGMKTNEYHARRKKKQRMYKRHCKYNLVDVFPKHLKGLEDYLDDEIKRKRKGYWHL